MQKTLSALAAVTLMATAAQAQMAAPAATSSTKTMHTAAQTATRAKTPMAAKSRKAIVPHSAVSLDCSKQADAKGLHGKAREVFRSKCKHAGPKG